MRTIYIRLTLREYELQLVPQFGGVDGSNGPQPAVNSLLHVTGLLIPSTEFGVLCYFSHDSSERVGKERVVLDGRTTAEPRVSRLSCYIRTWTHHGAEF